MLLRKLHHQLWLNILLPDHPRQLEHLGSVKIAIIKCCAVCFYVQHVFWFFVYAVSWYFVRTMYVLGSYQWHLNAHWPYWWFTYIRKNKVLLHSSCTHQINLLFIYWSIYVCHILAVAMIIYPCFMESTIAKIGISTTNFIVYGKFKSNLCLASRCC
jgi:hypothetical protein